MASGFRRNEVLHHLTLVGALLGTSGCLTRDKYDPGPSVLISSPTTSMAYTNGTVHITAAIDPPLDLPIVLRRSDGVQLIELPASRRDFDWDTTGVPEGTYQITAEVMFSDDVVKSHPVAIVVDRKAPTVVSLTPTPGAQAVMLRSPLQVVFSEPIVLSQPAASTFSVSASGTSIATSASLDAENRIATITLADLPFLSLPAVFAASIASTITDRAGNALVPPTGTWSWSVPQFIELPNPPDAAFPRLAVGFDLAPVVAWDLIQPDMGAEDDQLRVSRSDGLLWTQLTLPSSNPNSGAGGFSVALDGRDRPFLCWIETSAAGSEEIHVASWTGSAWDTSRPTIAPSFGPAAITGSPTVRVDGAGQPLVLWQETASPDLNEILLARWNGTQWDRGFAAIDVGGSAPMDFVLSSDNPIVSWVYPAGTGHVAKWSGTNWIVAPDLALMTEPFMALDAAGNPMVATGGSGSFIVQRLTSGNQWQPSLTASVPPQAIHPRIAAGPDGVPILAWVNASTEVVGMARFSDLGWDTRPYAFGLNAIDDQAPELVVDRQGSAWVGWRDHDNRQLFNLWISNY
jgi:hypothetical protein